MDLLSISNVESALAQVGVLAAAGTATSERMRVLTEASTSDQSSGSSGDPLTESSTRATIGCVRLAVVGRHDVELEPRRVIVDNILMIETRKDARLAQHFLAELGRRVLEVDLFDGVLVVVQNIARSIHRAEAARSELLDLLKVRVVTREQHAFVDTRWFVHDCGRFFVESVKIVVRKRSLG